MKQSEINQYLADIRRMQKSGVKRISYANADFDEMARAIGAHVVHDRGRRYMKFDELEIVRWG